MKAKAIIVLSVLLMLSLSGCSDNKGNADKTATKETVPLSKISINTETANNIYLVHIQILKLQMILFLVCQMI